MPVKLRRPKTRRDPLAEAKLWSTFFDHGCFLLAGTDDQLGVSEETADEAAGEAWGRLGRLYLTSGIGHAHWALEAFGEPRAAMSAFAPKADADSD